MKIAFIVLPASVQALRLAFVNPRSKTRTTFVAKALFAGQERIGHLEPIPVPRGEPVPETPGIPQGADSWPCPVQDPNVLSDRMPPETPGLNRVDWPPVLQEPNVNVGPPETPGLNDVDWPAATQEPNV